RAPARTYRGPWLRPRQLARVFGATPMYRPASSVSSAAGGRVWPGSTAFGDRDMIVSPSGGDGGPSGSPNPDQDEYTRGAFGSSTSGRSGPESPHADRRTRRSTV